MADNWDDSDDDWDVPSDSELEKKLNALSTKDDDDTKKKNSMNQFDDEEDLALKEKREREAAEKAVLKQKGSALAAKKAAEDARKEEEEIARKAMAYEAEMEANLTPAERKKLQQQKMEDADMALADDLFGGDAINNNKSATNNAGDAVIMRDLKDHLKHAKKVGQCCRDHKKAHLTVAFLKELVQECKDVLGDDEITDLIKTCNVIKNDKVAAAKKKVKGQAQKAGSKKADKAAEAKAKKIEKELFGESATYDQYDDYGADYEDDFF